MNKQEALDQIEKLKNYIIELDKQKGTAQILLDDNQ